VACLRTWLVQVQVQVSFTFALRLDGLDWLIEDFCRLRLESLHSFLREDLGFRLCLYDWLYILDMSLDFFGVLLSDVRDMTLASRLNNV
jgi:hypothetical protein